ncbi:Hypothetical protein R9X50_00299800 [Acrodontium crateriforme]|uniref:MI domain-containing protein n=1 Tax=Acrodontium crateriforme TaxID=150365 RepID=A0AAQ3M2G7_9PEZI|nr:Hypothetical protein R9X50_00299800 [Acrodontium crateriforme]
MVRDGRGPKLPKVLLDQFATSGGSQRREASRKDRRKAERQQKKTGNSHSRKPLRLNSRPQQQSPEPIPAPAPEVPRRQQPERDAQPAKSILKKTAPVKISEPELESEDETDVDRNERETSPVISKRAAKAGLAADDAEIAALEKRLGIKGKKNKKDNDLAFLLGSDSEDEGDTTLKRKRPEDTKWLRDKRLKAAGNAVSIDHDDDDASDSEMDDLDENEFGVEANTEDDDEEEDEENSSSDMDDIENPFSEDELSEGDFDDGDSDLDDDDSPAKVKENPYVPPVSKDAAPTGKYIPPSLRKAASSDDEMLKHLQKQVKGQLNRLSEANLLSILQAMERMYENNARQHMTSTLIELLMTLVCDPSPLNDTFLILHAGFAASIYKVVGTDFGAQLLEKIVESFDKHRVESSGKETLNLVAFLAGLYTFQVVGSEIVFDYIRLLLAELSENNTELLLRVIRTSGPQLRQDDPSSLKDIVLLLHRNVAGIDKEKLSVRTKFMIETINDLKNNRMKTGVAASSMVSEHIVRMKKTLGSMNTRSIKATQPLSITLADIKDSEKKGKWWLVGASYYDPAKLVNGKSDAKVSAAKHDDDQSTSTNGNSWQEVARQQGMNTNIRRSIFITIHEAQDFKEAEMRLLKLNLNAKQRLEIPWVLVRCAGAAKPYNPYYTLIARQFCTETQVKKAFQFALWDCIKRMDKDTDPDDEDEDDMDVKKIVRLAKLFGTLVAEAGLSVTILKNLEFAVLSSKTKTFAEVMLTTIMTHLRKKDKTNFEHDVKQVFVQTQAVPSMIQGLRIFIQNTLCKASLANGKSETKAVTTGSDFALEALLEAAEQGSKIAPAKHEDDDLSDGSEDF